MATRAELPYRNTKGDIVDRETWTADYDATSKGMWSRSISAWPSATLPGYRLGEHDAPVTAPPTPVPNLCGDVRGGDAPEPLRVLREALPSADFIRDLCHDARDLVVGCAVPVCSPSCFKYNSKGASHICRHGFYNVVTLYDESDTEIRRRRRGKPLRGCVGIFRDTRFGMAGRIITYQVHPWECATNYAALIAARCNVDVQDLRRTLRPDLWHT